MPLFLKQLPMDLEGYSQMKKDLLFMLIHMDLIELYIKEDRIGNHIGVWWKKKQMMRKKISKRKMRKLKMKVPKKKELEGVN